MMKKSAQAGEPEKESAEFIPETRFELIDRETELGVLERFLERGPWLEVFFRVYPELRQIEAEAKSKEEKIRRYREFLERVYSEKQQEIETGKEKLEEEWNKVGRELLQTLAEHFETNWPIDKEKITGFVSVMPVFPRYLDRFEYLVGYKDSADSVETAAHEILHFLWFKKWKEIFPETPRHEYERPHLAWKLSEIMDPIILQCHPKISGLIHPKHWGYSSFQKLKIGEVGMMEYFKNIYLKSVEAGDSFEVTLKKLWEEAKAHEEELDF